ncbi:hypothetical protein MHPYR_50153 [uncultured Mycobacterium sp.]|uniref:Uncharacterized protein n=1 Tax=uncultured Mycobacterium sp. TaxID=171292 RepID=A0A1Y5PGZ0_9MYCO|nr:hypothetical protein MHPYR_50153 [uncultured Mycobacterium sp.]
MYRRRCRCIECLRSRTGYEMASALSNQGHSSQETLSLTGHTSHNLPSNLSGP